MSLNDSIRIRLDSHVGYDYYTQGEWSEWFVCTKVTLSTPTNFSQVYEQNGVRAYWDVVNFASKYVYTINGGAEQETTETGISGLKGGDVVKVKAVPASLEYYIESAWSVAFTIVDTRTALEKPSVTFNVSSFSLEWEAVENASYYNIYDADTGELLYEHYGYTDCGVVLGRKYVVVAIPSDYETYCPSQSDVVEAPSEIDKTKG